jgi:ankyrin repeat protein
MTNRREILLAAGAAGILANSEAGEPKPNSSKPGSLDSEKFRQAVITGDVPTVASMLDRDPALRYSRDAAGVSVYTIACLKGQPKIAEEIASRSLVLDVFEAAVSGDSKRANEIAKDDPGLAHHRLPDGRTPLHLAAEAGKPALVTFFAMKGADLSAGPESPLLAAVDYPDHAIASEMATFLLINASDPNAQRRDGKAALELATARGYDDLVQMLIHRGAEVSHVPNAPAVEHVYYGRRYTQDLHGNPVTRPVTREDTYGIPQDWINQFVTLAHFDFEKVKQLQKLCPTLIMTRATWDELAIEAASHMGLTAMAQFLADLGAPVSACTATLLGEQALVKRLVSDDAGCLRERGAHDIALLAYTALGDQHVEIAEFLLGSGADIHARSLGLTSLHFAANKGHLELAQLFLDHGADVNAVGNVRGASLTPLGLAVQTKHEKMAALLKERGGRS